MTHALNFVLLLIVELFNIIMAAIAVVENFLRSLMTHAGVAGQFQKPVLIVVAVLLILLALRLFGRLFGALVAVFVVLLLLHILLPSLGHSSAVHLQL